MRVHDVMVRPVVTVSTDTPVRRAAVTLTERGFAALPVLDHQQRLAGVLTSGDGASCRQIGTRCDRVRGGADAVGSRGCARCRSSTQKARCRACSAEGGTRCG